MLELNPGMMIWTWITFGALAFVLYRVAWKPLLSAVENREKHIHDSIQKAEDARAGAEKALAEQEKKLASAHEDIQKMLKESKEIAEKTRQSLIEQAREDASKLVERAKADIEKERQAVITSLKQEVADLVVDATSKLVGVVVDKSRHQQIIDESIANFGQKN